MAAFPERHSCAQARAHRRGIVDESCHDAGSHAPGHPPRRRRHRPILGTAALGGPPGQFRGTPDAVRPPRVQGTRPAALAPGAPARAGRHDTHDSARGRNRVRLPALLRRRRRPARHRLARLRALPRTDGAPVAARTRPPCRHRRGLRASLLRAAGSPHAHGGRLHRPGVRAPPGFLHRNDSAAGRAGRSRRRQGPRHRHRFARARPRVRRARRLGDRKPRPHLHGHFPAPGRHRLDRGRHRHRTDRAPRRLRRPGNPDPARRHGHRLHGRPRAPYQAPHSSRRLGHRPRRASRQEGARGCRGSLPGGLGSARTASRRGRGADRGQRSLSRRTPEGHLPRRLLPGPPQPRLRAAARARRLPAERGARRDAAQPRPRDVLRRGRRARLVRGDARDPHRGCPHRRGRGHGRGRRRDGLPLLLPDARLRVGHVGWFRFLRRHRPRHRGHLDQGGATNEATPASSTTASGKLPEVRDVAVMLLESVKRGQ